MLTVEYIGPISYSLDNDFTLNRELHQNDDLPKGFPSEEHVLPGGDDKRRPTLPLDNCYLMITQGTPSGALDTSKFGSLLVTVTWVERSGAILELAGCMHFLV